MMRQFVLNLGFLSLLVASPIWVYASDAEPTAANDLAVVESAALGTNRNLPWSEPVQIEDPFEGSFIGVFDRHSFSDQFLNANVQIEIQSLWSQDFIRILSIVRDRDCLNGAANVLSNYCSEFNNARNIIELFIKIDGEVFQVARSRSTFPVTNELAEALQNAPETSIAIRLVTESGETIDSEIGQATIEAWKTVYASPNILTRE
ncbi:MAG: hypothetical protein AAGH78_00395 [Cyanobacteria bacterium P01_H01_bin.58]